MDTISSGSKRKNENRSFKSYSRTKINESDISEALGERSESESDSDDENVNNKRLHSTLVKSSSIPHPPEVASLLPTTSKTTTNDSTNRDPRIQSQQMDKKTRISPITAIFNSDVKYAPFARRLSGILKYPPILSRRGAERNSTRCAISTTCLEDYRATIKFLETEKIEFFVFTTNTTRTIKAVIRDLDPQSDLSEIKAELTLLGLTPTRVTQLRQFKTKTPLPLFLIELPLTEESPTIYEIKSLLFQKVRVEPYNGINGPRQCHKCQRFGHVSECCSANARCVKCGLTHQTSECLKSVATPGMCANCGEAHTANYRGCRIFRAVTKAFKTRQNDNYRQNSRNININQQSYQGRNLPSTHYTPAPSPQHNPWTTRAQNNNPNNNATKPIEIPTEDESVETTINTDALNKTRAARYKKPLHERTNQRSFKNKYQYQPEQPTNTKHQRCEEARHAPDTTKLQGESPHETYKSPMQATGSPCNIDYPILIQKGLSLLKQRLAATNESDIATLKHSILIYITEILEVLSV